MSYFEVSTSSYKHPKLLKKVLKTAGREQKCFPENNFKMCPKNFKGNCIYCWQTDLRFVRVTSSKWSRAQVTVVTHEIVLTSLFLSGLLLDCRCRMVCLPLNVIRIEPHCVRNALWLADFFRLSAARFVKKTLCPQRLTSPSFVIEKQLWLTPK